MQSSVFNHLSEKASNAHTAILIKAREANAAATVEAKVMLLSDVSEIAAGLVMLHQLLASLANDEVTAQRHKAEFKCYTNLYKTAADNIVRVAMCLAEKEHDIELSAEELTLDQAPAIMVGQPEKLAA